MKLLNLNHVWNIQFSIHGVLQKKYIQFWESISNIFFQQESSKTNKYIILISVILIITIFFQ